MHERAHSQKSSSEKNIRIARSLQIKSEKLGLFGETDIVEFHKTDKGTVIFPVEYKAGKPKEHNADKIQLCAQAMCLEEMLSAEIPCGALFYGKTKRREDVVFDNGLRNETIRVSKEIHDFFNAGITPAADYSGKKCSACSFLNICRPKEINRKNSVEEYYKSALEEL